MLVFIFAITLVVPINGYAEVTVYDDDPFGWETAVDGVYLIENFDDEILNPELSVVTTYPGYIKTTGVWWDRLVYSGVKTTTTWKFAIPVYAFGGTWNLGGPGGPGSNIEVLVNGSWVSVGVIDRSYINRFWGFVSDVPFTQVRLQAFNNEGWCETYELDDMVYSALEQYLTGGGQIVAGEGKRKNRNVVSFSGNLGYAGDLEATGQYQFHFHNVSLDDLDGAIFHSTAITNLQFFQDSGEGAAPPLAYSNVAYYVIEGRLKMKGSQFEAGYTLHAYVTDRGEPGENDAIHFVLLRGSDVIYSSTWDFPHNAFIDNPMLLEMELLAAGNLQVHSE
jgi:hypothetical protein